MEGVSLGRLLHAANNTCTTNALLRFEPCDPPAEWAGGPSPPAYKAVWSEAFC